MAAPSIADQSARDALPDALNDEKTLPLIIYGLYILGWFGFLTVLIGVVMAYVLKAGAGERACSHYIFQIRTFWIGLALAMIPAVVTLIGLPLTLLLIGFKLLAFAGALMALIGVWATVRAVTGLIYISRGEMHPRPRTWLF